jgi:hypothetical protein
LVAAVVEAFRNAGKRRFVELFDRRNSHRMRYSVVQLAKSFAPVENACSIDEWNGIF